MQTLRYSVKFFNQTSQQWQIIRLTDNRQLALQILQRIKSEQPQASVAIFDREETNGNNVPGLHDD